MRKITLSLLLFLFAQTLFAQDAYYYAKRANAELNYGNYEKAITLYTKAIELKPDFADWYANRGYANYMLKNYEKAIPDYMKDNSMMKERSSYSVAASYLMLGKMDETFRFLEICQKSEYKQRKSTLEADKDFEKLKTDSRWQKIISADYSTPFEKAMWEVDDKYLAKDMQGSLAAAEKAISLDKTNKKGYLVRGQLNSQLKDYEKAIPDFDKVIQLDPKEYGGYANKAVCLQQLGKSQDALDYFNKAVEKNPEYLPNYETAMLKYGLGNKDGCVKDLREYLEINYLDDMSWYFCATVLYQQQKDLEARDAINKAIAVNPAVPDYFMLRGNTNQVTKKFDDAIADYTKAIELNGNKGEAYYKRGLCKAEKFALTKDKADKQGFCSDMEKAEESAYPGAAQYLRELCE
jgi:tetratricopeptide (TPR) repeat protein